MVLSKPPIKIDKNSEILIMKLDIFFDIVDQEEYFFIIFENYTLIYFRNMYIFIVKPSQTRNLEKRV